ncbi:MAG: PAS domain-containing protein [Candidatus Nitrohelix vancouverensis]|uniref:histidine kinase n=1 Tax=Candidatus Nitrohelix vancouverensis TaxID=2705534 RepID=A0A7T0C4X8_9BACT|nr:MAG: PAS domain-containing protein [Candidatus Nitrohelix vancouverensis]
MAEISEKQIFDKPDSLWRSHREKLAWVILILDLVITFLFWDSVKEAVYNDAKTRFDFRVEQIHASVDERMATYEQMLRGGIGLFIASTEVTRDDWRTYVEALEMEERFPGIQGLGYSEVVQSEEKEEHTRKIQAEGFPDYTIKPSGERDVYTSIIYLEPFNLRNRQAFGYDMFSQSVRREAMEKARDTGRTAITGKVTLVQEIDEDVQSGFLMYLPLYKKGLPVATEAQRRNAIRGYVYSAFRMGNLMAGILGPKAEDVGFKIYDGGAVHEESLMYRSYRWNGGEPENLDNHILLAEKTMDLYGRQWTVQYASLPGFEASINSHKSNFVLVFGGIFSALCFFVIHGAFTTRRQAIQYANEMFHALKDNEERLSYALEGTNDGLWDWNIEKADVYFSPRRMSMFGYEPGEFPADVEAWNQKIHPDDLHVAMNAMQEHLNGDTPFYQAEYRIRSKNGSWVWTLDRGKVVKRDAQGKPLRIVGTNTDLSLQKFTEEKLMLAITEAEQANRGKSVFLANMSHEIRTPLNAILGYAQILLRKGGFDSDTTNAIKTIDRSGNNLLGLINEILDLSKIDAGKMEVNATDFDLQELVQNISGMFEMRCEEKSLAWRVDGVTETCVVYGDEGKVRQILTNLIGNAVKFTDSGSVSLKVTPLQNDLYLFEVVDTGKGIPEKDQDVIFEPFRQETEGFQKGGTGLGLAICQKQLELMHSELNLDSELGKGSRFYFALSLPATKNSAPLRVGIHDKVMHLAKGYTVKALVVDDVEENREVLSSLLEVIGADVKRAVNGLEALRQIRLDPPDIVFMDMRMPVMGGREAILEIQKEFGPEKFKIVVITASVLGHQGGEYKKLKVHDFISKPFREEQIFSCLKNLLDIEFEYEQENEDDETDNDSLAPIIFLPEEILLRLTTAAETCNITELEEIVLELNRDDETIEKFSNRLKELMRVYDMEKILELLKTVQKLG